MQMGTSVLNQILSWEAFFRRVLLAHANNLRAPYKYFFVVTKKCGSRCIYCKIWKEIPENELSLSDYRQIARGIGSKMSWLNITGGEPTDREDLTEVIRTFKDECPRLLFVNFTTNGLRPDHIKTVAEDIVALGFAKVFINVSLDGPPEVNDQIRGVKGSFNQAMQTFLLLKKVKGLNTKLALTLYPQNIDLIEATYSSARTFFPGLKRSDLHLNVPHQSEHYYGNTQVKINVQSYVPVLTKAIRDFRRSMEFSGIFSGTNIMEYLYQKKISQYFIGKKSPLACQALQSSLYISEKGTVYPCTIWNKPLGNLSDYHYDISSIAETSVYQEARNQIKKESCPNCWTPCEAFTSILGSLPKALK